MIAVSVRQQAVMRQSKETLMAVLKPVTGTSSHHTLVD